MVIEEGTSAVDDGGDPLLGSYVPPDPGDASMPSRAPLVTIYYRTFRAVWDEVALLLGRVTDLVRGVAPRLLPRPAETNPT